MKPAKASKIIFWTTTVLIFLMEGVIPALTSQTELAKEGIRHLGYPEYFGNALVVFKIAGAIALIIPNIPSRVKEWAYAGFAFNFTFACISHWVVDGLTVQTIFPLFFLAVLITSYVFYHRLRSFQSNSNVTLKTNDYAVSGVPL